MTGSGGWSYYSATAYILGIRPDFDTLTVDPCVPNDWKEFNVSRVWRGATYDITVTNPNGVMKGVTEITVDGVKTDSIPAFPAGTKHVVKVCMG